MIYINILNGSLLIEIPQETVFVDYNGISLIGGTWNSNSFTQGNYACLLDYFT